MGDVGRCSAAGSCLFKFDSVVSSCASRSSSGDRLNRYLSSSIATYTNQDLVVALKTIA